jgi:uncharacterized repeat protein (TIGR03803 family)
MKWFNSVSQAIQTVASPESFGTAKWYTAKTRESVQLGWVHVAFSLFCAMCVLALGLAPKAWGDTVIHDFVGGPTDGKYAIGTPVHDVYGNLYGTTNQGGLYGFGMVFVQCVSSAPGPFPCVSTTGEFVLYNFKGPSSGDGAGPRGTLIFGGNYAGRAFTLYGTTYNGGSPSSCLRKGCGTVFELCAPSNFGGCGGVNTWQENVLHRFLGGTDGANPFGGVIADKANNLYGTTVYGGHMGVCNVGSTNNYCGTVFKLKSFAWAETILHRFSGAATDGANPYAALCCNSIFGIPYLFGTTLIGGTGNLGTVFVVQNSGTYPTTILHNFVGGPTDGALPYAKVIFDSAGNLYATTSAGGVNSKGTAFQLVQPTFATENVLYNFCSLAGCIDGATPFAGLTFDSNSNLYGTTYGGGNSGCTGTCGTVFELSPAGIWTTETVLWPFAGGADGSNPFAGVIFDPPVSSVNLYGATRYGGTSSDGVLYSVP